jgi:hypothetical protein
MLRDVLVYDLQVETVAICKRDFILIDVLWVYASGMRAPTKGA